MKTTPLLLILAVIIVSAVLVGLFLMQSKNNDNNDINLEPTIQLPVVCNRGGCSGQLCIDENSENGISTCEFREEYGCFSFAVCEAQENGECGWTLTDEYNNCIAEISE